MKSKIVDGKLVITHDPNEILSDEKITSFKPPDIVSQVGESVPDKLRQAVARSVLSNQILSNTPRVEIDPKSISGKMERIVLILKSKGMDSQQQQQAATAIREILEE